LRKKQGKTSVRVAEEWPVGTMKTEYTEQNIHNNKNIQQEYIIYKIKQKHTKYTTMYIVTKKMEAKEHERM